MASTKGGVNLCKLHGATEDKQRTRTVKTPPCPSTQLNEPLAHENKAEISPAAACLVRQAESTDLAELLVELLQGRSPEESCQVLAARDIGGTSGDRASSKLPSRA